MFPKSLFVVFIIATLLTSGGTIYATANNPDMSTQDKIIQMAITGLNTPNAMDDLTANSIKVATSDNVDAFDMADNQAIEDNLKKFSTALAIIFALGLFLISMFIYKLVKWIFALGRPPESEQRLDLLSIVVAILILFALTGFTTLRVLFGYV